MKANVRISIHSAAHTLPRFGIRSTNVPNERDDKRASRYEVLANDPKYRHFNRIPGRIMRCLEHFGIDYDRVAVESCLRAYYIFIGVIDSAIDSGHVQAGEIVLRQLESRLGRMDKATKISETALATAALRHQISEETYPELLTILRTLSEAVQHERTAGSMTEYIEVRKTVGRLTARASNVLIRPWLYGETGNVFRFMERVGEIGCLVDSVIDLRADGRSGLLRFKITLREFSRLLKYTIENGAMLSIEYPQLFGLFLGAVVDNVADRFRARTSGDQMGILSKSAAPTAS